jgi:flagellin
MAGVVNDQTHQILRHLNDAREGHADALAKLSSGEVFTRQDPRPADRALTQSLELKLRSLSAAKRNINDAVSFIQTADAGFSEITNILSRMKEINVAASSTTMTDKERKFLFVEHQALQDEMNRIAETTTYNDIPLLNGNNEKTPEQLVFRIDAPHLGDGAPNDSGDWNEIRMENLREVITTAEGLGIRSAREYLEDEEGISLEVARDLMAPEDDDRFSTVYDEALDRVSHFRSKYGAMQTRLQKAMDFNEVVEENIAAAKSKIADTDYAAEVSKLARNQVMMQATTGLLTQANFHSNLALSLINQGTS